MAWWRYFICTVRFLMQPEWNYFNLFLHVFESQYTPFHYLQSNMYDSGVYDVRSHSIEIIRWWKFNLKIKKPVALWSEKTFNFTFTHWETPNKRPRKINIRAWKVFKKLFTSSKIGRLRGVRHLEITIAMVRVVVGFGTRSIRDNQIIENICITHDMANSALLFWLMGDWVYG